MIIEQIIADMSGKKDVCEVCEKPTPACDTFTDEEGHVRCRGCLELVATGPVLEIAQ